MNNMISRKFLKAFSIFATSAIFSLSTIQAAFADLPGTLPDSPLFLSNAVEPNVFFTLDDSGSMDWGPMQDSASGLPVSGGLPSIDGRRRAYYTTTFTNLYRLWHCYFVVPPFTNGAIASWDASWVVRTHLSNRNYYNPSVKYEPWPGLDANGDPLYLDANPNAALEHPDIPGGESVNLATTFTYTEPNDPGSNNCDNPPNPNATAAFYIPTYYTWPDNNADGAIDARDIGDGDDIVEVSDLTTAEINAAQVQIQPGDTAFGIDQWQNFANWFQYHRSRMNSTKSIIGGTINKTDASRMGMRMFNADQLNNLKSMRIDADKRDVLEDMYSFVTQRRGTPARTSLKETWDYFADPNSGAILDQSDGGECQQNFNILMSDGFWNSTNSPNVGNADSSISGSQKEGINPLDDPPVLKRFDGDQTQSVDGGNYADSWNNTLADVAMHNYEEDLSPLADRVPTSSVDLASHQHLVTYTIAFGLNGTLDPTVDDPLAAGFTWPQPVRNTNTTVDDMWHAAYNGRGQYLSAQNPQALEASLDQAISDIAKRTATAAAVSINSAKLTTKTIVYLAEFNSNGWQGNLFAYKIKTDLFGNLDPLGELEPTPVWDAASLLNSPGFDHTKRVVMTHDGSKGIQFKDFDDLGPTQQADLRTNPAGGTDSDTIAQARLDHIRGSRDNEGTGYGFRQRLSLLSDLVNSGPVFVGAPGLRWPDKAPFPEGVDRYSDFKNGPDAARQAMVYTGSNGGLLHGFDADTGEEKMAYVASNLFSTGPGEGLHYLTDPDYKHKFYNDLTPTVSDVFDGSDWQTILISGQRGGGRGIYALDVTDPTKFTDSDADAQNVVMWEFTSDDNDDLGYTYSRPQIGLANDGSWVAIFGNGYNDTGDGRAKLFILKIHQGTDGSWTLDNDYRVIDTGPAVTTNGLSTPALADIDGNGTIDRAYAGDLEGKLWAFDLSSGISDDWDLVSTQPLFTTIGNRPITAQPTLSRHPTESTTGSNEPNIMVFFGSGQWLAEADKLKPIPPATYPDEYFYGVWDKGPLNSGLDQSDLVQQTFENGFVDTLGNPVRVLTRNPIDYATGTDFGWYFILPDDGERSVTRPVVRGDVVFFNTYVPESDPCEPQGYGYRMAVDIVTGGSPENPTFDVNQDGVIDDKDRATNSSVVSTVVGLKQEGFLPEPVFIEDIAYTADTPAKVAKLKKIPKGRFSWQELIQ
jgi:type IV pilus assembly protein PilY1